MPVDSRRLQGPENTICYTILEQEDGDEMQTDAKVSIIDDDGIRKDKRKSIDARPLCKLQEILYWRELCI